MDYENLLKSGALKPFKTSPSQIKSRLDLARRDIRAAQVMMAADRDWAFSMAYNAILQATRALMFARGFSLLLEKVSTRSLYSLRKLH